MRTFLRKHVATFVVATVAAMVAAGGIGLAHDADGGGHDSLAHKANKLKKVVFRRSAQETVAVDGFKVAEAVCPGGFVATGGGSAGQVNGVDVVWSFPSDGTGTFSAGRTAWTVNVTNTSSTERVFRAYVVCVKAANTGGNYSPGANKT